MYCRWCGAAIPRDGIDSVHVCGATDRPAAFCMNLPGACSRRASASARGAPCPARVAPYRPARPAPSARRPVLAVPPKVRDPELARVGQRRARAARGRRRVAQRRHRLDEHRRVPARVADAADEPARHPQRRPRGRCLVLGLPLGVTLIPALPTRVRPRVRPPRAARRRCAVVRPGRERTDRHRPRAPGRRVARHLRDADGDRVGEPLGPAHRGAAGRLPRDVPLRRRRSVGPSARSVARAAGRRAGRARVTEAEHLAQHHPHERAGEEDGEEEHDREEPRRALDVGRPVGGGARGEDRDDRDGEGTSQTGREIGAMRP